MGGENDTDHEALVRLRDEVSKAKARIDGVPDEGATRAAGMAAGLRMGSEFVAAVLVGAVMGYGVDLAAKTLPLGLLVGLVLGFAAGAVNVVRAAKASSAVAAEAVALKQAKSVRQEKEEESL